MTDETTYTKVTESEQVTEEILTAAEETEQWFGDGRIDWDEFWDRLDGYFLTDGTRIDLGNDTNSAAMRKIKRHINTLRRQG